MANLWGKVEGREIITKCCSHKWSIMATFEKFLFSLSTKLNGVFYWCTTASLCDPRQIKTLTFYSPKKLCISNDFAAVCKFGDERDRNFRCCIFHENSSGKQKSYHAYYGASSQMGNFCNTQSELFLENKLLKRKLTAPFQFNWMWRHRRRANMKVFTKVKLCPVSQVSFGEMCCNWL